LRTTAIRRITAVVTSALSLGLAFPSNATAVDPPLIPTGCTGDPSAVTRFSIDVAGEPSSGRYSLPATTPNGIVVIAHGYGHTTASWVAHMTNIAEHGLIAVGMDYRGTEVVSTNSDGSENSRGWPARKGAQDLIAAGKFFSAACPFVRTIVAFGVSMGGNMSGLAVAEQNFKAPPPSSCSYAPPGSYGVCVDVLLPPEPLFDYWFDIEGAVNVSETYNEARAVAPVNDFAADAEADIRAENGGETFEQNPQKYEDITVITKVNEIRRAQLSGVIVVHGMDDGLVPYNQSREMVAGLRAMSIPTEDITVGQRDSGESGTTLTGNTGQDFGTTGHASEKSTTHVIMRTSLGRLFALFDQAQPPCDRKIVSSNGTDLLDSGCFKDDSPVTIDVPYWLADEATDYVVPAIRRELGG
jgi:hypothetical protein